jgi:hypothetical protein
MRFDMKTWVLGAAASAAVLFSSSAAFAGIVHYDAVLKGAGRAHGELSAILDTDSGQLECTVNYTGLAAASGDFEGGPASIPLAISANANPIQTQVTLDKAQIEALGSGGYSFDLKGAGADEIRGKVYRSDD